MSFLLTIVLIVSPDMNSVGQDVPTGGYFYVTKHTRSFTLAGLVLNNEISDC